jgi:hypothetical protein
MLPTDQGFQAHQTSGLHLDFRLIEQPELAARDRAAQVVLELLAGPRREVERRVEHLRP